MGTFLRKHLLIRALLLLKTKKKRISVLQNLYEAITEHQEDYYDSKSYKKRAYVQFDFAPKGEGAVLVERFG